MVFELGHQPRDLFKNTKIDIRSSNSGEEGRFAVAGVNSQEKPSGVNNVNKFIGDFAKNYMKTTTGENWTSNLINHLNCQFPTSIKAPQGHTGTRQKVVAHGLQTLMQQEILDANPHQKVVLRRTASHSSLPACLSSADFDHSNPLGPSGYCTNENYYHSMSANTNNSGFFGELVDHSQNVYDTTVSCGGMNLISPLGVKEADRDLITSPEQISSITACSYGDMISDTEAFDSRASLPDSLFHSLSGSSADSSFTQQPFHQGQYRSSTGTNQTAYDMNSFSSLMGDVQSTYPNSCSVQHDFQNHPEAIDILPGKFGISNCGHLWESQLQMPRSGQCTQWPHQPSMQFNYQLKAQSNFSFVEDDKWFTETMQREAYGVPHHNSDIPLQTQQHGVSGSSSHKSSYDILTAYVMYKGMPAHMRSEVSFQDYMHAAECSDNICNCLLYGQLATHFDICNDLNCTICGPVRKSFNTDGFLLESRKRRKVMPPASYHGNFSSTGVVMDTLPLKRLKMESSMRDGDGFLQGFATSLNQQVPLDQLPHLEQWPDALVLDEHSPEAKADDPTAACDLTENAADSNQRRNFNDALGKHISAGPEQSTDTTNDEVKIFADLSMERVHLSSEERTSNEKEESYQMGPKPGGINSAPAVHDSGFEAQSLNTTIPSMSLVDRNLVFDSEKTKMHISSSGNNHSGLPSERIKTQSVSLAKFFTASQIKEHLASFTPPKDISGTATQAVGQNTCQLCSMEKLVFPPAPIYCSSCGLRIKRNAGYYRSADEGSIRHCFCTTCFKGSRGPNILMRGISVSKANLQKAKNDEEIEDSWVLCDRCQCWQHRICGLYNDERDAEGKAEYVCPKCCLEELESGKRVPLTQTSSFGAKDLPRTNLSDHIEQRLFRSLNKEREDMAKVSGIEAEEIPGAEGLVVRVVVSVDKLLKVKQKFIDILHGEDYPAEFVYKSKLIFLFQNIEGVDVCLFGMCVQEFGSECGGPNQRCVYISYLDSVKYFRPERQTVTGESLRTFVYHEILIGYLEHCKMRGFATCYIWACPPYIKGEDYIFYCHPETQKTPKQDKLRQWYKSMLKKAAGDGVVVDQTNLYDQFFFASGERNTKVTAARLPYFDGDYWSGAAENIVTSLEQEESPGGLQSKLPTKRTLKSMGQDSPDIATKDVLVMQKLGQKILPFKENFMILRLRYNCSGCCRVILSGSRWFCNQCKKIQLCSRCYDAGQHHPSASREHTCHSTENNELSEVVENNVTLDTSDKDDELMNSFFETRDAFLNKCQKSNFRFDALGRAKYSSMMILYHLLHKPTVCPTCSVCDKDVAVEKCWNCDTCRSQYVCGSCYGMKGDACHIHKLTQPSTEVIPAPKSERPQTQKMSTLNTVLDALIHASQCESSPCSYNECCKIRRLFYHASRCNVRYRGGCTFCRRVWIILKEHSRTCRDSSCRIPRCMDIKKHTEMIASCSSEQRCNKDLA